MNRQACSRSKSSLNPAVVIVYPNCKINLGLRILEKRSDGYHNIETAFYPVNLTDILEIAPCNADEKAVPVHLSQSGFSIDGDPGNNLCSKAYKLLKKDFPDLPKVDMHLHKSVPAGAGLGAGSADGAFTLKLLNENFKLDIPEKKLMEYALKLGSDCPFFILNKPCYATGRGEILDPVQLDLSGHKILLANPGIHINTGKAFLGVKPSKPEKSIRDILSLPIIKWKEELINDFEMSIFKQYTAISDLKKTMYDKGALFALMSGSGSTVYGIFKKDEPVKLSLPENYFVRALVC